MLARAVRSTILALLFASPSVAVAQSLQEVLNQHYAAIGGLDKWKAVRSMKVSGRMAVGPGIEAPFTMLAKRPMKARLEFTFQGMTGIQAYDGTTAWMVMPFMGKTEPEEMPAEDARNMQEDADLDGPLVDYQTKGHQVELVGKEEMEGTPVYKLKVTLKSGDVRYHYLDAEHYLPIKIEGKRRVQGTEMDFETVLGDYKDVGGLIVAHSIEARPKGAPSGQVLTIDTVEWNVSVEDSVFSMPKKPGSDR
jgi:hypothetical protein